MYVYKYSVDVYLLCIDKGWSVSPSSSSFLLTCIKTTTRNELARLGMGTIFLVYYILLYIVRANFVLITRKEGGA